MLLHPVSELTGAGAFGVVVLALAWASPGVATNYGTVCQNCSSAEREACALKTATQMQLSHNDQVWVFDLAVEDAEGFRVLESGSSQKPAGSQQTESSPAAALNLEPIDFSSQQWAYISGGMRFVDEVVLPNGGQIFQACHADAQGDMQALTLPGRRGNAVGVEEVSVPVSLYESAYDVVGNHAAGVAIGEWWANKKPAASFINEVFTMAENLLNMSLNSEVALLLNFSDGSRGLLVPDPMYGNWAPDFETFRDSDHNPIPAHPDDLQPGSTYHFSGDSPGESNLQRFLNRASLLGMPITGPNGGPLPADCKMTADRVRCTSLTSY